MKFRLALAFFALVVLLAAPVRAETTNLPIGKILEIEGTVNHVYNTGTVPLAVDDDVYANDKIATGAASRAVIMFVDDTQITLGEGSEITLDKYVYDPEDTANASADFNMIKGSFLLVSGLLTKNGKPDVHIKTSAGTIGLRGTTVWGGRLDADYGVLVQDGEVDVTNEGGTTTVPKGQGTFMKDMHEKPRPPKVWAKEKTDRAVKTIVLAHQDEVATKITAGKTANIERRANITQTIKRKAELKKLLENKKLAPEERTKLNNEYKKMYYPAPRILPRPKIVPVEIVPDETAPPAQTKPIDRSRLKPKAGGITDKLKKKKN
jgi:hypothetical protein